MKANIFRQQLQILIFLCCCISISCFAQNDLAVKINEKTTFLGGYITEPTEQTLSLHVVENHITLKEKIYQIPLSYEGEFRFEFPLKKTTLLTVHYAGQESEVYMEPGDALKIASQGDNLQETITFEGTAALHNEYLKESKLAFILHSNESISQKIVSSTSMEFRRYMDKVRSKRKQFLADFIIAKEQKFSTEFLDYAHAAIDYWWAYNLMRYRTEFPAGNNIKGPMSLPSRYYGFLRDIKLSNDIALINRDYLYFLDLFLDFAKENPQEWQEINQGSDKLIVKNSSLLLIKDPSNAPMAMPIDKGKILHISDKRLLEEEEILDEALYQVEAFGGLSGWMRGRDITYSNQKPEKDNQFTETKEIESSYIKTYIKGRFHRCEIREVPYENKVKGYLWEGEEAEFLLNQTTDKFVYPYYDQLLSDYWYEIRKKDGTTGWVFRGGVSMSERKVTVRETKEITYRMSNEVAKAHLNGESLYYALAKDIYKRANTEEQAKLKTDVFNFIRVNPISDYNKTVRLAYENALRRRAGIKTTDLGSSQVIKVATPPSLVKKDKKSSKKERKTEAAKLVEIDNLPCEMTTSMVAVHGKVYNPTRRKISLTVFSDPILYQEDKKEIRIAADGSFTTDFALTHGVLGEINYAGKSYEIYLEPGDNLSFAFDANSPETSLSFAGTGARNNKYLKEKNLKFAATEKEMRIKLQYANAKEYSAYMDKAASAKRKFFSQYSKKNKLSKSFSPVAEADISYWQASNMLNYPYEHPLYNDQPAPMDVPEDYYNFLKNIQAKERGLPAKNYVYFLQQYLDYLALLSENKNKSHLEIAKENLSDEAYYFCRAKMLASSCRRGNLVEAGQAIDAFITECPYEQFSNTLRFAYNEAKGLTVGQKAPDFELTDINGQTVRLSDFAGKVVYVDFWATWCAPCRRYLPHSQALAQKFPADQVEFLYISLDDSKKDWEDYVRSNGLHGTHLCAKAGHGYHSKIAELYKVKSLPSYFLIDQKGRIAKSPAASPSGSKIVTQIEELLEGF